MRRKILPEHLKIPGCRELSRSGLAHLKRRDTLDDLSLSPPTEWPAKVPAVSLQYVNINATPYFFGFIGFSAGPPAHNRAFPSRRKTRMSVSRGSFRQSRVLSKSTSPKLPISPSRG